MIKIPISEYKAYFKLDLSAKDSRIDCGVEEYKLIDFKENSKKFENKAISLDSKLGSDIIIDIEESVQDLKFYLQATTLGNKVAK